MSKIFYLYYLSFCFYFLRNPVIHIIKRTPKKKQKNLSGVKWTAGVSLKFTPSASVRRQFKIYAWRNATSKTYFI